MTDNTKNQEDDKVAPQGQASKQRQLRMKIYARQGALGWWRLPGALAVLLAAGSASAWLLEPPPAHAPLDSTSGFSLEEASRIVGEIARKPHPATTGENRRVREMLVRRLRTIGLEPEAHEGSVQGLHVESLLTRLPGARSTGTVVLAAHYDSVAAGPGAADDAAGVAAVLETMRALKSGPPLANEVVALLTDGEERGMLGAKVLVEQNALDPKTCLILNFEARGNCGASILFETSEENGRIVSEALAASPWPVAHSMSDAVYRLLPNDTDLTIFKKAGFAGLNFAFIDGVLAYHTSEDSPENLGKSSLLHHGTYAVALARHFGNLDRPWARESDVVYFNTLGPRYVCYQGWLTLPMALAATLGVAAAWHRARKEGIVSARLTLAGAQAWISSFVHAVGIPTIATWTVTRPLVWFWHWRNPLPWRGFVCNGAAVLLVAAAVLSISRMILRKRLVPPVDLCFGGIVLILALLWPATFWLRGATPTLLWPLGFGCLGTAAWFWKGRSWFGWALSVLFSVPAAVLLGPVAYLLFLSQAHQSTLAVLAGAAGIFLWILSTPWILCEGRNLD